MGRIPQPTASLYIAGKGTGNGAVVAGEFVTVHANSRWRADGTVPGLIYCAGKGAGALNAVGFGPVRELARRGYVVLSGDLADTQSAVGKFDGPGVWGNDASLTSLDAYKIHLQGALGGGSCRRRGR